jgi:hypothetical protein
MPHFDATKMPGPSLRLPLTWKQDGNPECCISWEDLKGVEVVDRQDIPLKGGRVDQVDAGSHPYG